MKQLFLFLSVLAAFPAFAQNGYVESLMQPVPGQGEVRIVQEDFITRLVNGEPVEIFGGTGMVDGNGNPVEPQVRKVKMYGYRVQVYAGGNSRAARQDALLYAGKVKAGFSEWAVYTLFKSPRWICSVGDFRTYEEANRALRLLRETGNFEEATIVKSIIQIAE